MSTSVAALLLSACSAPEATTPVIEGTGGLRIVSGSGQGDSVQSVLGAPLIVELRDSVSGQPIVGATVVFDGTNGFTIRRRTPYVTPFRAGNQGDAFFKDSTQTDARGRATVRIQMGTTAGEAQVVVTSTAVASARVTARYTIVGGRAAGAVATPDDTALYVGKSYQLTARAADAFRNPTVGLLQYAALTPEVATISNAGVVTALRVGRASFRVSSAGGDTTVSLTVPPAGILYAVEADTATFFGFERGPYRLFRSNLDGSDRTELLAVSESMQAGFALAPDLDTRIATFGTGTLNGMRTVGTSAPVPFPASGVGVTSVANPAYAPRGDVVYFSARTAGSNYELWRSRPDGSEPVRVGAAATSATSRDLGAAVSPDGRYLAYWTNRDSALNATVRVLDLASGGTVGAGIPGHSPRWRPDGKGLVIIAPYAYVPPFDTTAGRLATVTFDGTGLRLYDFVRPTPSDVGYRAGFSLSPDGSYALARSSLGTMELVDLTTFERLPLPFTRRVVAAEWR